MFEETAWPSGAILVLWWSRVQVLHPDSLDMFSVAPSTTSWLRCVNRELVCLPPVVIFKYFVFIWNICFAILPGPQSKLLGPLVLVVAIKVYYLLIYLYLCHKMHCRQHQVDPIFTFIVTHESTHVHQWAARICNNQQCCNISNTRKRFHPISKHREVVEKTRCSWVFFNQPQGVWISDETPFRMFDIASQTSNNSWRKSKRKFTKFYDN